MTTISIAGFYNYSEHIRKPSQAPSLASYAIHQGLWTSGVSSREEAVLRTNEILSDMASIRSGDMILDAGCGLGSSSLWLAKKFHTSVLGISLAENEVESATRLARDYAVDHLARFEVNDFENTGFADSSFDVVWAVESAIYSNDKSRFLRESYRLLKKGGRIVVADLFLKKDIASDIEKRELTDMCEGFVVPSVARIDTFLENLKGLGFNKVTIKDMTAEIRPTLVQTKRLTQITYPLAYLSFIFKRLPEFVIKNMRSGLLQEKLYRKGYFGYYLISALK